MTVITTSTSATSTAYSNQRKIDRTSNGVLWAVHHSGTEHRASYSLDNGVTWTLDSTAIYTNSTASSNSSFFIDQDDYAHVVFRQSAAYIYYRRGTPNASRTAWTWSAAQPIDTALSSFDTPDVIAHREGTGWKVHIVYAIQNGTASGGKCYYRRYGISSSGVLTDETATTTSIGVAPNSNNNNGFPSIDFNHTGDGKTVAGGTPHLYVTWSNGATGAGYGIRFKKATYSAGSWTWGAEREIDSTLYWASANSDWLNCMFDGTRVILAGNLYNGASRDIILHERDAADTTTVTRKLVNNAAAAVLMYSGSSTYDSAGNVYFFGQDQSGSNGTCVLHLRKWQRSSETFEASASIDTSAPTTPFVSAKRGYSNNRIEFIYTDGTASPYNVTYSNIKLNLLPLAPSAVQINKLTSSSVTINWTHSDPDGDPQSKYKIRWRTQI